MVRRQHGLWVLRERWVRVRIWLSGLGWMLRSGSLVELVQCEKRRTEAGPDGPALGADCCLVLGVP